MPTWIGRMKLPLLALCAVAFSACPLNHPIAPCCGTPQRPMRVPFDISTRPDEVPIELQGCGANREEITAISINPLLVGCARVERGAHLFFPSIDIEFTTSSARCQGTSGVIAHRLVRVTHLVYDAAFNAGPPPCVRSSTVDPGYQFDSRDPAFATLFATRGPQTLLAILDRYALGWAAAAPGSCPPAPVFRGTTARCPS